MGIYIIRNVVNGKCYVGSALNIDARWSQHQKDLRKGKHHSVKLLRAWQKYGYISFVFEVLEVVVDASQLVSAEQKWIDYFRAATHAGYNVAKFAAAPGLGMECSPETRAKLSKALLGRKHTEETRAKMLGRVCSPEVCKRMGDARRGQQRTPEQRAKMSVARKGIGQTDETRAKISAMLKGRKKSLETRGRMAAAQRGIPCHPEERAKISATKKAKFAEMKALGSIN